MTDPTRRLAKITRTSLGVEDHGIFTGMLVVDYGGSSQAVGGWTLDAYDLVAKRRVGTAFGCEWIQRTLRACGVREWEKLVGRTIFVLFEDDSYDARPIGIENLPTEPGERFMFKDLVAEGEEIGRKRVKDELLDVALKGLEVNRDLMRDVSEHLVTESSPRKTENHAE